MSGFPVHSDGQCGISLWFNNGVQEGDGPIFLVVLHCELYGRVNTVDVLKEAFFLLTSYWMTKVSSTYLYQNLGGVGAVLRAFCSKYSM